MKFILFCDGVSPHQPCMLSHEAADGRKSKSEKDVVFGITLKFLKRNCHQVLYSAGVMNCYVDLEGQLNFNRLEIKDLKQRKQGSRRE